MECTLTSRYLFQGTIQLTSALHIGGGTSDTAPTDSPVVRTPDGLPYIPGSSFKGVFRSTVEKLVQHVGLKTCFLQDGRDCFQSNRQKDKDWYDTLKNAARKEAEKAYKDQTEKTKTPEELYETILVQKVLPFLCDTCQLFGNGFSASRIFFSDLYLATDAWAGVTQIRDGVVIDRDSEKAVDRLKFDFEVVPVGAEFTFEVRLENPRPAIDLGLTCLGLNEFLSGLGHLGGNRSRGLGNCTMKLNRIYSADLTRLDELKRYLMHTDLDQKMSVRSQNVEIQKFLQTSIDSLFT